MSLFLNMPEFWVYQCSEYASGFEYARILNIPELRSSQYTKIAEVLKYTGITQGSEYA